MTRSGLVFLAGLFVAMAGATTRESAMAAEPPADKTPTMESRLRDLEYPELRKRSTEEIEVLKELASSADETFKRVEILFNNGSKGGEAEKKEFAGLHAQLANAELAWAEGRVKDAYAHTFRAVRYADRYVRVVTATYESDVPFEYVCDAQVRLAKTKLQLIRAERVAKAANVDLTEVKRSEKERSKGEE